MEQKQTFGVDFFVRKSRTNKSKSFIYVRINLDGERADFSINEEIDTADWEPKSEMVKGRTFESQSVNEHIEDVRVKIRQKYRELQASDTILTADAVKQAYFGVQESLKGHKLVELLDYFEKIWKPQLEDFKNYRTTIKYVKLFLVAELKAEDVYLSRVNMEFVTNFEHFIRENPIRSSDPCDGNGLGKHIQRFKRIISWAKTIKWVKENQVVEYSTKLKKNKRKKLSIDQLVTLETTVFQDEKLQVVQDIFLYSCYTGLGYAESQKLADNHFEWDTNGMTWCLIYRDKTDELCPVPLLKSAARILDKYRALRKNGETKIFPRISNQELNRCLKIVCEICGFSIELTFHIARHTFAKTVALKNGIPLETVQIIMGHTKITTTQIYADVDEEKILEDTKGLEEKLDRRRALVQQRQAGKAAVSEHPVSQSMSIY